MKSRVIVETESGKILSTGVCLDEDFNVVPEGYTAYENTGNWDDSTHKLLEGEFVEITQTDAAVLAQMWVTVRMRRDFLLAKSDWTQVADTPLNGDQRTAWQIYRQDLREVTSDNSHVTDLASIDWPTSPS